MSEHKKKGWMPVKPDEHGDTNCFECPKCDIYDSTEANCRECLQKGHEPDCPYIINGKCIGKNACDLQDVCKFYKDGDE